MGRATITSEPDFIQDDPWELKHYIKAPPPGTGPRRVRLRVDHVLQQLLTRQVIRTDPELATHLIFRFSQMTNFPLRDAQAAALEHLYEAWQRQPMSVPCRPIHGDKMVRAQSLGAGVLDRNVHERHFEDVLAKNPGTIEVGLVIVGRQYIAPGVGRMDLLCKDKDGTFVVVEIKRPTDSGERVVEQIAAYMSWVREKLADDGRVRGIIIGTDPSERLRYAAKMVANLTIKTMSLSLQDFVVSGDRQEEPLSP